MTLQGYKSFLSQKGIALCLSKPYGLEMLYILERCERLSIDNGIEDTFELIEFNKPRKAAFTRFVQLLVDKGLVLKVESELKASKLVLRLSNDVSKTFKSFADI